MAKSSRKKLIALVGRPNVGKSTMFNLLTRTRKALVEDTPGLTRDRNYADVTLRDKSFTVVDTGGFEPTTDDVMLSQMRTQTMVAIRTGGPDSLHRRWKGGGDPVRLRDSASPSTSR